MEISSVAAIANALNTASIRYLVVGGLAVNAHGYQRFTSDLDLVIQLVPDNIHAALKCLSEIGFQPLIPITSEEFADAENRKRWKDEKEMFVLNLFSGQHRRTPIDIFITEPFDFMPEWQAATHIQIDELTNLPVVRLETLLEMKRTVGRAKDMLDIEHLQRLNPYRDATKHTQ